jgi:hypothetical protein
MKVRTSTKREEGPYLFIWFGRFDVKTYGSVDIGFNPGNKLVLKSYRHLA